MLMFLLVPISAQNRAAEGSKSQNRYMRHRLGRYLQLRHGISNDAPHLDLEHPVATQFTPVRSFAARVGARARQLRPRPKSGLRHHFVRDGLRKSQQPRPHAAHDGPREPPPCSPPRAASELHLRRGASRCSWSRLACFRSQWSLRAEPVAARPPLETLRSKFDASLATTFWARGLRAPTGHPEPIIFYCLLSELRLPPPCLDHASLCRCHRLSPPELFHDTCYLAPTETCPSWRSRCNSGCRYCRCNIGGGRRQIQTRAGTRPVGPTVGPVRACPATGHRTRWRHRR